MAIFHLPVPSLVFERRNPNLPCRKPAFFMLLYIQIVLDSSDSATIIVKRLNWSSPALHTVDMCP